MEQNTTPTEATPAADTAIVNSPKRILISTKAAIIICCILIVIGLGYYFRSLFVAVTVNGDVISRIAVIKKLEATAGSQVLDGLVSNSLIDAEAKSKNITVSEDEIAAEITKLEDQFKLQNTTLDDALKASNIDRATLREQIIIQKKLEKILADKIAVTDAEVTKYIADNKISIPKGGEEAAKKELSEQLRIQKLNAEVENLLADLKAKAKIKYYVNY